MKVSMKIKFLVLKFAWFDESSTYSFITLEAKTGVALSLPHFFVRFQLIWEKSFYLVCNSWLFFLIPPSL